MTSDPFALLDEIASVLPPAHWMLVGGPTFSKTQTAHVNRLLQNLNNIETWNLAGPAEVRRAIRAAKTIRADWAATPKFLTCG